MKRTRLRRRNPERRARDWPRQFGSEERVEAIRREPCIVPGCRNPSQNCHTRTRRTSTWRDVFACCDEHHREQHRLGIHTWSRKYGIDPFARAAALAERHGSGGRSDF